MRTPILLLLLALTAHVYGEVWVNLAGESIEATPERMDKASSRITFKAPTGETLTYPLAIFSEAEQLRLRLALGEAPIPPQLIELWDFASAGIIRTKTLLKGGHTPPEAAEKQIQAYRNLLLNKIKALPDLTPQHREALLRRAEAL